MVFLLHFGPSCESRGWVVARLVRTIGAQCPGMEGKQSYPISASIVTATSAEPDEVVGSAHPIIGVLFYVTIRGMKISLCSLARYIKEEGANLIFRHGKSSTLTLGCFLLN
ncbi:unnamed protein product [Nezara viridula]|uniref:Uncharacterized protein n=1 Tax=Nezara viridula TaxID=85310 RepID=A0A9P0HSB5_NEZVI|nr:unnamed protein product [Nezara viridula]